MSIAYTSERSFEQSLLRLGLDRIDILLLHDVDVWTHGPEMADQRFREAMEGSYKAVHELRSQGVVKAVGRPASAANSV